MRKLLFLLFLALSLHYCGSSQLISINLEDSPLENVFTFIQQHSSYRFVYANEDLAAAKKVTVSVNNAPVTILLEKIFRDQPLSYRMQGQVIMVSRKNPVDPPVSNRFNVTGKVVDAEGNGLPAVTLVLKDKQQATATDDKGNFSLAGIDPNAILLLSSVGYESREIRVDGRTNLQVQLLRSVSTLDETVIKGYYSTSRKLNTGAVAKISSEDIGRQPVGNVLSALEGRLPGVYLQQKGGLPGSNIYVEIRGRSSIGSATDPLYIVDGVPFTSRSINSPALSSNIYLEGVSPLSNLNPSDIERIEILKDADATAIYGSRGANGVVLITTKKGRSGKTAVEANVYSGSGKISHHMDLLNTQQYVLMRKEAFRNDGVTPTMANARDLLSWDTTKYTNWQEKMLGGTAHFLESRIGISGGNEHTQFLLAGDFRRETTVFPGTFPSTRSSGMLNLSHHTPGNRFSIDVSANYVSSANHLLNTDLTSAALFLPPNTPDLIDANGNLLWPAGIFNSLSYTKTRYESNTSNFISNAVINYRLLPGLTLKTNLGYTQMFLKEINVNPLSSFNPAWGYTSANTYTNFGNNSLVTWIAEPQVNYTRKLGRGVWDFIVGMTFQDNTRQGQTLEARGFPAEGLMENIGSSTSVSTSNAMFTQYKYSAFFGRIGYNYADKYLVNLTGRRDGSSRFGPDKQFGNFAALGLGWVFSKEKFIINSFPFLSFGKLRASYGSSGNDQIQDYQFMDLWQSSLYPYNGTAGLSPARIINPDYSWERTKKLDIGLETGFLKDRIRLVLDYYRNRTDNQLVGISLPPSTGAAGVQANFPALVENKGWELEITCTNIKRPTLSWSTALSITLPSNKLLQYDGIENTYYGTQYTIGKPLSLVKAYHYTGVNPATGVFQFEDNNKDGMLSYPEDLQSIKTIAQQFYGGMDNRLVYHGFELDVFVQFTKQTGLSAIGAFRNPGFMANQPVTVLNRWQQSGDITSIQRFSQSRGIVYQGYTNAIYYGDNKVTDASFMRLKNIALSWQLPVALLAKIHLQQVKIYMQAHNLWTKTNYIGLDPENQNAYSLPSLKMLVGGIQITL